MKTCRASALASSLAFLAVAASAQPKQDVKPPQAQAWIDVATFSGTGMPMGGPGGGSPMGALGGLFGGGGSSKVSFLMTQSGASGGYVDVTLMTRRNPQLAEAVQNVPAGFLSPALKLVAPRDAAPAPRETDDEAVQEPQTKPQGKISLYWGCGDAVRAGQPRVVDLATANPAELAQVFQSRRATQRGAHAANGRPHWPNPSDARALPAGASVVGAHEFTGDGVPAGFRFSIPAAQDLMPPMQLQQADQGGAIALSWAAQPNARAFFVAAIAARSQNEMVIWTSSEVPDLGMGLIDYQTNGAVDRWLREKVLLSPATTRCTVPKGILSEGAMLRAIAFGHELNLVHPPRPSDPKVAWEPEWAVKVRVKAVGSAMVGMPSMEAMRPADTREAKESEPAEKKEDTKKPSALDILRGVIGR